MTNKSRETKKFTETEVQFSTNVLKDAVKITEQYSKVTQEGIEELAEILRASFSEGEEEKEVNPLLNQNLTLEDIEKIQESAGEKWAGLTDVESFDIEVPDDISEEELIETVMAALLQRVSPKEGESFTVKITEDNEDIINLLAGEDADEEEKQIQSFISDLLSLVPEVDEKEGLPVEIGETYFVKTSDFENEAIIEVTDLRVVNGAEGLKTVVAGNHLYLDTKDFYDGSWIMTAVSNIEEIRFARIDEIILLDHAKAQLPPGHTSVTADLSNVDITPAITKLLKELKPEEKEEEIPLEVGKTYRVKHFDLEEDAIIKVTDFKEIGEADDTDGVRTIVYGDHLYPDTKEFYDNSWGLTTVDEIAELRYATAEEVLLLESAKALEDSKEEEEEEEVDTAPAVTELLKELEGDDELVEDDGITYTEVDLDKLSSFTNSGITGMLAHYGYTPDEARVFDAEKGGRQLGYMVTDLEGRDIDCTKEEMKLKKDHKYIVASKKEEEVDDIIEEKLISTIIALGEAIDNIVGTEAQGEPELTMDELNWENKLVKDYIDGMAVTAIQSKYGISAGGVYTILNNQRVPKRDLGGTSKIAIRVSHITNDPKTLNKLLADYKNNVPVQKIFDEYGIHKNGLYFILDSNNVPRRGRGRLKLED